MPQPISLPGLPNLAVLALPAGGAVVPGVVVVYEITGFRADTHRHCTRSAAEGRSETARREQRGASVGRGGVRESGVRAWAAVESGAGGGVQATRTVALRSRGRAHSTRVGVRRP